MNDDINKRVAEITESLSDLDRIWSDYCDKNIIPTVYANAEANGVFSMILEQQQEALLAELHKWQGILDGYYDYSDFEVKLFTDNFA